MAKLIRAWAAAAASIAFAWQDGRTDRRAFKRGFFAASLALTDRW